MQPSQHRPRAGSATRAERRDAVETFPAPRRRGAPHRLVPLVRGRQGVPRGGRVRPRLPRGAARALHRGPRTARRDPRARRPRMVRRDAHPGRRVLLPPAEVLRVRHPHPLRARIAGGTPQPRGAAVAVDATGRVALNRPRESIPLRARRRAQHRRRGRHVSRRERSMERVADGE